MTAADHANTVRAAIEMKVGFDRGKALAALDALEAQAKAIEKRRIVTTTVQGDMHMNRLRRRAEAAEAERDRLRAKIEDAETDAANARTARDEARDDRDRLADALRDLASMPGRPAGLMVQIARAALARTENTP